MALHILNHVSMLVIIRWSQLTYLYRIYAIVYVKIASLNDFEAMLKSIELSWFARRPCSVRNGMKREPVAAYMKARPVISRRQHVGRTHPLP